MLYYGRLDDDGPILEQMLDAATSVRRWNPAVLAGDDESSATKVGACRRCRCCVCWGQTRGLRAALGMLRLGVCYWGEGGFGRDVQQALDAISVAHPRPPPPAPHAQVSLVHAATLEAARQLPYLHAPGTHAKLKTSTHWVVADLGSPQGRALVQDAVGCVGRAPSGGGGTQRCVPRLRPPPPVLPPAVATR